MLNYQKKQVVLLQFCKEVDGQVLVLHDMLGMNKEFNPRFLRRYLNLLDDITKAVENYINDVRTIKFPNENEQY